jgi:predicted transcriptional regulator/DNA-binding XRE family transcriptional regulator
MPKLKNKVIRALRRRNAEPGILIGQSLRRLRELVGLTQSDLAERLRVGPASISKIERRGDVQISSLQKYLEALGAKMRIEAALSLSWIKDLRLDGSFERELQDENQLIFPLFGDELFYPTRDIVLSVRPHYSDKIFKGTKTIELRRRFPKTAPGGITAYIYSTSPVQAMVGSTEIKDVIKLSVADIWKKYGKMARIDRLDFDDYFSGLKEGFALKIANARSFARPIDLSELRERFGFEPPQSFLYACPILRTALKDEYPNVSN